MDRMTLLVAFANRGFLTIAGCSGVVQKIEHECGGGANWLVTLVGASATVTVLVVFDRGTWQMKRAIVAA